MIVYLGPDRWALSVFYELGAAPNHYVAFDTFDPWVQLAEVKAALAVLETM